MCHRARHTGGLEVATARGIVLAHGGEIWVQSEVGRGSAFHFTLPAAEAEQPSRAVGIAGTPGAPRAIQPRA